MKTLPRSVWIPVLALALCIFGWKVQSLPLTNWDEGIYANVNLELFHSHDWTKLTYFGKDFLEKPPLQFWLTYLSFGILGPTEVAVRLWSVLAGMGTAVLLAVWAWQARSRRWVALLAGGMLILGRFALIHVFRTGDLDGLMIFFITVAMYSYWRVVRGAPRWMLIWGVASAAAILTKSLAGVVPIMVVGLDVLMTRGWQRIGWGNLWWGVGAFVGLAAPWHIVETIRFGSVFWQDYLGVNVVQRATDPWFAVTPWHYYLTVIRDRFFPFSYLLLLGIPMAIWRCWKTRDPLLRIALLWAAINFFSFTVIQSRREWYIAAIYPALILIIVQAVQWWHDERWSTWLKAALVLTGVLMFGHVLSDQHFLTLLKKLPIVQILSHGWWTTLFGQLVFGVLVVAFILGVATMFRRWLTLPRRLLALTGASMVVMALAWSVQFIRSQPTTLPLKTIATRLDQERLPAIELIGTKLKKQPAGYFYILRLDTHTTEVPAGSSPHTPVILTTLDSVNAPLNTSGRALIKVGNFVLIDFR
jgi:4-amino-4-deoxy-L-arabinose transferase-like glycosyltransferase